MNKVILFLILIFILGCILRLYQLSFFEFKNDQLQAIHLGNQTRQGNFLISHGTCSGIGINNPPLFLWFMGWITYFSQDPLRIAAVFNLVNLIALILAIIYFYKTLPRIYALISSVLLAFSPAFVIYSNIIWAQCLLPLVMILFQINLYKFIKNEKSIHFIFMGILVTMAAQLHMSGFFLFSLLLIIAIFYRKKLGVKPLLIATIVIFIMFLPYLYHLLFEGELKKFIAYADFGKRPIYWQIFREHLRMTSVEFLREYFRYDFNAVLAKAVGWWRLVLYPLSLSLVLFFIVGLLVYPLWLGYSRRIFDLRPETLKSFPLAYQVSGLMIWISTLGFLITRVEAPPYYLLSLYPAHALITGWSIWRIWEFPWLRVVSIIALSTTVIILVGVLNFVKKSGGHPYEYGVSYHKVREIAQVVKRSVPVGICPKPEISFLGKGKTDKAAAEWLITRTLSCRQYNVSLPVKVEIRWNNDLLRYEYQVEASREK